MYLCTVFLLRFDQSPAIVNSFLCLHIDSLIISIIHFVNIEIIQRSQNLLFIKDKRAKYGSYPGIDGCDQAGLGLTSNTRCN